MISVTKEHGMEGSRSAPSTPSKKRRGDRYIPAREGVNLESAFRFAGEIPQGDVKSTYNQLLRMELSTPSTSSSSPERDNQSFTSIPSTPNRMRSTGVLKYSPSKKLFPRPGSAETYSTSPVRLESQRLLLQPRKKPRSIPSSPYKVLDAPDLADDFYLNLIDWGAQNKVAVGLGKFVYIWDALTGDVNEVTRLESDEVASVSWIRQGTHLAVGTLRGYVQIWDVETNQRLRQMQGHSDRASSLSWNEHILSSGSRDYSILHRDVRIADPYIERLTAHSGEVCGLRWNLETNQLASGCNGNQLIVWDHLSPRPLYHFHNHTAAVKALAWSPHQRGLLASGGGSSDRSIRFWNTLTGRNISTHQTSSQVCNLAWSLNTRELISTHGYSDNYIAIWKYPQMDTVATLMGHSVRVLYLAMSPDGNSLATGAGDETLRLWNINDGTQAHENITPLDLFRQLR